ncbi:MFS transporter [Nostoc sp. TCL26-01]|uniref:MFS transporter n=1 Tax=Nostoc sp. TCL26-01 TaxID=2576904 RepID=UPI0015C0E37D|nr:MFS transporter [Nostoc sp. TCL26-01]QLE56536.1 MFS transporter [Nostoc sp. TCL26-01]
MSIFTPHSSILWRQVWGLAAMLAAIVVSLMIYGMYQSQILSDLGFVQLVAILGIIQGLIGSVMEPLVGGLSDRILRQYGSRLPQITIGVTLAGLLFALIAILLPANLPGGFRWLFLLLMGVWLAAMIAIRGPVVALLIQFAPTQELPIANAIVMTVLGLVGALNPILETVFRQLGKSFSFLMGAIILIVGAILFLKNIPRHTIAALPMPPVPSKSPSIIQRRLIFISLVGIGAGLEINMIFAILIPHLQIEISFLPKAMISAIVLLIAAISAHPWGWWTSRWGAAKSMQLGLGSLVLLMAIALFPINSIMAVFLLISCGIALGLVFTSMVPFALSSVPFHQTGLSTGLYFGGNSAGLTLLLILKHFIGVINLATSLSLAAIAFAISTYCLHCCRGVRE